MHILVIPTSYPNRENPVKNIFIKEQVCELSKLGHKITVLHINKMPTKKILARIDDSIRCIDDTCAIRYEKNQKTFCEGKFPWINRAAFLKNAKEIFAKVIEEQGKPDVIYAHFSCWAGYAAVEIAKEIGIPVVTLEHFSGLMCTKWDNAIKKGVSNVVANSNKFVCVSDNLKNAIKTHINIEKDIYVVGNIIDSRFVYHNKNNHNSFTFLGIGNLNSRKAFNVLIESFIKSFKPSDEIYLRIGGDGPERKNLEKLIKDNRREHQIILLGKLNREQTLDEYINCDCFCLTSQFETFGLVYREALAVGRPIITTDHGGFDDGNWHNEYGYKIPVNDVDACSKAMLKMKENIEKFDLEKISKICIQDCAASNVIKKIENILYMVADRK